MKKFYYLIMLCLLAGAANSLAAQEVSVTNLQVASDNTITFDVSWGKDGRTAPWSDTVWVFVDYFNMDKQQMWRLSSAGTAYLASGGNNAGFYIKGNARTAGTFSAACTVTPVAGVVTTGSVRPCVYVTDYQPTATYGDLSGSAVTVNLTGTAPYSGKYGDGTAWTLTSGSSFTISSNKDILAFADATGSPGIVDTPLFDTGRICGDFKAGIVGNNSACVNFDAGRIGK